jgi:beta-glucosidase-like glycosyl hydrolase
VPSCANDFLLRTILRDSWSFDGYVVSDCDAVDTIYNNQCVPFFSSHDRTLVADVCVGVCGRCLFDGCSHFTKTPEGACAVALHAGTDLNCGDFYQKHLGKAHSEGRVTGTPPGPPKSHLRPSLHDTRHTTHT